MMVKHSNSANLGTLQPAAASSKGNSPGPAAGLVGDDHVQIGPLGTAVTALDMRSGELAAKVGNLADAIGSSRYQVDPHVVSVGLIQEHMLAAV